MQDQDRWKNIIDLDGVVHNPARLMIVYLLSRHKKLDYLSLMRLTGMSSGNITTHLQKLTQAGYVLQQKNFVKNKPHTSLSLTAKGSAAYERWGESVIEALPEKTVARLQVKVLREIIPWQQYPNFPWDLEQTGRFSLIGTNRKLQLYPPLAEAGF
jgi:DNA-binding MarR family transcriptional regulator